MTEVARTLQCLPPYLSLYCICRVTMSPCLYGICHVTTPPCHHASAASAVSPCQASGCQFFAEVCLPHVQASDGCPSRISTTGLAPASMQHQYVRCGHHGDLIPGLSDPAQDRARQAQSAGLFQRCSTVDEVRRHQGVLRPNASWPPSYTSAAIADHGLYRQCPSSSGGTAAPQLRTGMTREASGPVDLFFKAECAGLPSSAWLNWQAEDDTSWDCFQPSADGTSHWHGTSHWPGSLRIPLAVAPAMLSLRRNLKPRVGHFPFEPPSLSSSASTTHSADAANAVCQAGPRCRSMPPFLPPPFITKASRQMTGGRFMVVCLSMTVVPGFFSLLCHRWLVMLLVVSLSARGCSLWIFHC